MRSTKSIWLFAFAFLFTSALDRTWAAAPGPSGHWEGAITLPATSLQIRVDLNRADDSSWTGTIDIPVQGLRGYKLSDVAVEGQQVRFAMPGIPGDPRFAGKFSEDGQSISGNFSQAGTEYPFKLERATRAVIAGETPDKGVPGQGMTGYWQGSLRVTAMAELRLVLDITSEVDGKLAGTMVSVDQGEARVPITRLGETNGAVHFEVRPISGVFDGTLAGDGSEIAGKWKQGLTSQPLVFKRLAQAPNFRRPQDPQRPYPYLDEDVMVQNRDAGITLAGTLTRPKGPGPFPAVVLITGSGPQDRNEALMGHRPFLVLADYLTRHGVAVLRCDDRGFGRSTGDFSKATDSDFVEDTLAQVAWLKARKGIDPARIGLIGHSEGGVVAPRVATKSRDIAFIVLLAGVGVPMQQVMERQGQDISRVMGLSEEWVAKNLAAQRELVRIIRAQTNSAVAEEAVRKVYRELTGTLSPAQREAMGLSDTMIEPLIKMTLSPWAREFLSYDPRPTLKRVRCPVLALNGTKDLQVAAEENLTAIREAVTSGGNQEVKTVSFPGLNHLFQTCKTGAISEYGEIEETINPVVLKTISDWIHEVTRTPETIAPTAAPSHADAGGILTNADFEIGKPGEVPPGWRVPAVLADQGFSAVITTNQPRQGNQCVEIRWPTNRPAAGDPFANLLQRIDGASLRGKRIRVTAAIRTRTETPEGRAQMWLRVDRPSGIGAFDNMNDRPVRSDSWGEYSITVDVADDARAVTVGLMTLGGATAWWDDVRLEVLDEFKTLTEPPKPLSEAGLRNLIAFTRLLGYVRHFHPSDEAATNDWLNFSVKALPEIEAAESPEDLATHLESVFRSVAPTLRVFPVGKEPPLPSELSPGRTTGLSVRVWEHVGFRQDAAPRPGEIYRSSRLRMEAAVMSELPLYARPTNVFRADLGAGVACLVPTAVYADDRGTLPHRDPKLTTDISIENVRYEVTHRRARLATVMIAWNVLDHFYPYFDVIDTDWSKELEVALRKAAVDADEAAFYRTLNRLVAAIQDGHGTLNGPGMPRDALLPFAVKRIEGKVVVVAVSDDIPDLHPGDVVERIDGASAVTVLDGIAAEVSAATPQRRDQVAFRFGAGPEGSDAKIEVRGADGAVRNVVVKRAASPRAKSNRPPKLSEIEPGIWYVDVTRLSNDEFDAALTRLAKAKGLVFDVRGYVIVQVDWLGHMGKTPLQCARWNIPRKYRPGAFEWDESRWSVAPRDPQFTTNRVFLIDGGAISYSETVLGIVEAYHLGELVGEPTAGTNGNINQTDLPLGYRMIWTGMRVLKHDGSRHHGIGIRPTVPVSPTIQGIRERRDEQLERATALLK